MKKIVKDVYVLRGGPRDSHVYVLDDKDGYILIDTGYSDKIKRIDPKKVKYVFLTHSHYDHIGQAWRFGNIYCSSICFKYLIEWREDVIDPKGENPVKRFVPTGIIRDNSVLKTNNFSFRFFYAPSHTDDCIIIFEETKKLIFTGDILFAMGIIGRSNLKNSVKENYDKVIKKIYSLPWIYLLPGHGFIEKREIIRI